MKGKLCLFLLFIVSAAGTKSQDVLPLDKQVRTGKLANGFTYYIRHNEEPKSRVVFYLVNKTGSMQEEENQRGLAHFMEHMSFNGTTHYPKNELVNYLQKSGVRFGADLNAYTSFDETVYQLPLPADDAAIVQHGVQIMRDWAQNALLQTAEINSERGVVLEEKRLHNGAQQRIQDKTMPVLLNGSRYANRMPIGTEQVLKNFSPAVLRSYYKDWYRPNLQALIVVGDIDINEMERTVKAVFSDLKNPVNPKPRITYAVPLTGKNQFLAVTDPEQTSSSIEIIIKQKEQPLHTKADYRRSIISTLFNGAFTGRLFELSNKGQPAFAGAEAGYSGFMGGLDVFSVSVNTKPGKMKEGFLPVWSEIQRMQRFGITAGELERQKAIYLNHLERALKEKSKTASVNYVNEYVAYFLKGTAAPGIDIEYQLSKELLEQITVKEVNSFIASVIRETNRDIIVAVPEKEKSDLPDEKMMNSWIEQVKNTELTAYKDDHTTESLIERLPSAGHVISRNDHLEIGVTELLLSNGAKILLKPTDFKKDEILFSIFSEGGSSLYPDHIYLQAANSVPLIAANGAGQLNVTALNQYLEGKMVQVQPFIQDRYEGVNGGSSVKDLETALQLVHLYFTQPRKDSVYFLNLKELIKNNLRNRSLNPANVFADSVNAILGMHHYRRMPVTVNQIDSLDEDQLLRIYRERFANAGDFTFVFTGSIDTSTLIPFLEKYIGSLPSNAVKEQAVSQGIHIPAGKISQTIYGGNDAKAVVRIVYSGDYVFNDTNNIRLKALGSILQYRITERIRETEGGAYSPQASVNYVKIPENRYAFTILMTCAPENVEKLTAAANDEIEKLKRDGAPEDDLVKFLAEQRRAMEIQLRSNQYWLQYLSNAVQTDEQFTGVLHFEERLKLLDKEGLKEAAEKYFNKENYIRLVLMPEGKVRTENQKLKISKM